LIQAAFGGNDTSGPIEVATARNAHGGPHGRLDFESETFIAQTPIAFDTTQITSKLNRSSPKAGDPVHPLAAGAHPPVVFNPKMGGHPTMGLGVNTDGTTYTLDAMGNSNAIAYAQTVALRGRDGGATAELGGEVATALRASQGGGDKPHVLTAIAFQSSQSGVRVGEVHATLDSNNGSRRHNGAVLGSAVRRLTPVECERLQGFPDNWTRIPMPQRGKKAGPVWAADGPRYKALGNSMAVPVMHWIGARIDRFMPREQAEPVAAPVRKTLRFTAAGRMVFE
jgi:DNA (cytosine-5)-methyltransferase 1